MKNNSAQDTFIGLNRANNQYYIDDRKDYIVMKLLRNIEKIAKMDIDNASIKFRKHESAWLKYNICEHMPFNYEILQNKNEIIIWRYGLGHKKDKNDSTLQNE